MNYYEFIKTLSQEEPPAGLSPLLLSLWYDGKNDWESSHNIAQDVNDKNGSWIHAYLHRKEGDLSNARYWYHKAGKHEPLLSLGEEWKVLVRAVL
ncbi:MAG: hypothetical protein ABI415_04120 [Flavitalea sp.]